MRARWAIPLSIALLLVTAVHSSQFVMESMNRLGEITYHVSVAGLPLPYVRTFLAGPGGPPEYTEVLIARVLLDWAFWLAISYLVLSLIRRMIGN